MQFSPQVCISEYERFKIGAETASLSTLALVHNIEFVTLTSQTFTSQLLFLPDDAGVSDDVFLDVSFASLF